MRFPRLNIIKSLRSDESGATAVEFAIVSVPLIALILAALQIAIIFFYDQALQTVAEKSARQLMTGTAQNSSTTQSQFQSTVCSYASVLFSCGTSGGVMIDVRSATSWSTLNTTAPTVTYDASGKATNSWSYSPGNPGDIVIMRLMYNWPVFGGPLGLNLSNQSNGTRLLQATAVFKNEPYK